MAKQFRVKLTLEGNAAEAFSRIECKARFVAAAVEFYLSLGTSLEQLQAEVRSIKERLANGAVVTPSKSGLVEDDLETRLDRLIEKTLSI